MPLRLLDPGKGHFFHEVSSTNDLIRSDDYEPGSWILADEQTHGKGRSGKRWISFGTENIIFSGKNQIGLSEFPFTLLSLFSAGSLLRAILEWYPALEGVCKIKWPNDLYKSGKKIAGFLIESEVSSGQFQIIVGFGLNIYSQQIPPELSEIASCLLDGIPLEGSRERILYSFIRNWNDALLKIAGGSEIDKEIQWIEKHSLLIGEKIQYHEQGFVRNGTVLGYDRDGFLIVLLEDGRKHSLMDWDFGTTL